MKLTKGTIIIGLGILSLCLGAVIGAYFASAHNDSEGKLIAYVDGKVYATVKASDKALANKFASLHIGEPNNTDAYYFQDFIDEVAIFNVALTEDDINAIITRGLEKSSIVFPTGKLATVWGAIKAQ